VKQAIVTAVLLLMSFRIAPPSLAQKEQSSNPQMDSALSLEIKTMGNGRVLGRDAAFRTYATPDGSEGLVWYGEFQSEEEAKRTTQQWLEAHKVTSREQIKDPAGQIVGIRIVAAPKNASKSFIVIRRHGLDYWFVQSVSLSIAMQVDKLIEPPTHGNK
jgi:hypothetical protein